MKGSIILLSCFVLGIVAGWSGLLPESIFKGNVEIFVLYSLLLFVGIGVGSDTKALRSIVRMNVRGLIVPLAVALGSLAGAGMVSFILAQISFRDGMAVGAGFGYYSLSSILISKMSGEELGVIALLSNIFREVLTIVLAPMLARYLGKLAPIACGGATSMDTTLPIIHRHVGTRFAVVSVINGIVLSMLVPFLVPFLLP